MQARPSHSFAIGVALLVLGYVAFFTVRALDAEPAPPRRTEPLPALTGDPAVDRAIDKVAGMPVPDISVITGDKPIALSASVKKATPADRYSRWKKLVKKWKARGKPRKQVLGWLKIGQSDLRRKDEWLMQRIVTARDLNPELRPLTNAQLDEFEFVVASFRDQLDASGQLIGKVQARCMKLVFKKRLGMKEPHLEDPQFEQHIASLSESQRERARAGKVQPNSIGYLSHYARGERIYYHESKLPDYQKAMEFRESLSHSYAAGVIEWFHRQAILTTNQRNSLLENLGE